MIYDNIKDKILFSIFSILCDCNLLDRKDMKKITGSKKKIGFNFKYIIHSAMIAPNATPNWAILKIKLYLSLGKLQLLNNFQKLERMNDTNISHNE